MTRLLFDKEIEISPKTQRIWEIQLDLAKELIRICDKYDIKVYANGGTLIGCFRHKGFIPTDNDMDFMMTRDNYEKFMSIIDSELKDPYELSFPNQIINSTVTRLVNKNTTFLINENSLDYAKYLDTPTGIFVDIFVFDKCPIDYDERVEFLNHLTDLKGKINKKANKILNLKKDNKDCSDEMIQYFKLRDELKAENTKYNDTDSYLFTDTSCYHGKLEACWPEWWINEPAPERMQFEDIELPVPIEGRKVLNALYPGWNIRYVDNHQGVNYIIDPDHSYKDYLEL